MDLVERAERAARTDRIRELNDQFRRTFEGGEIYITQGVKDLPGTLELMEQVKAFDKFTPENDPHKEHDFGSFEFRGQTIFWKIDYYDPSMKFGSRDPSDPDLTTRVLTVMLASEY